MINQTAKKELLNRLDQHYISPLTEFYVEYELLKRRVEGRPVRRAIAMPDSWRGLQYQSAIERMTIDEAYIRLTQFLYYLDQGVGLVFSREAALQPHHSVPYFEWQEKKHRVGVNALLGQPHLLYFYKGNEEGVQQLLENILFHNLAPHFSVIGILPESLQISLEEAQIRLIDNVEHPFIEQLLRTRSLSGFFNQGIDLLLLDANGIYRKGLSRTEWLKNSVQLSQDYFPTTELADRIPEHSE